MAHVLSWSAFSLLWSHVIADRRGYMQNYVVSDMLQVRLALEVLFEGVQGAGDLGGVAGSLLCPC